MLTLAVASALEQRWRLALATGALIVFFQAGIATFYEIGAFPIFMIALAVPYLPIERISRPSRRRVSQDVPRTPPVVVAMLTTIVVASAVLVPPVILAAARSTTAAAAVGGAARILSFIGDAKPHNVFADQVAATVYAASVVDQEGNELPILFAQDGRRVRDTSYIRAYMSVEEMLRTRFTDRGDVMRTLRPLLRRAAARGDLPPGTCPIRRCVWAVGKRCMHRSVARRS